MFVPEIEDTVDTLACDVSEVPIIDYALCISPGLV